MLLKSRNLKGGGAVPIELPLMLFLYTIAFIACIEVIMLFWIQSSLSTVARQIATIAASDKDFDPGTQVTQRCLAAANKVGSFFPGYTNAARTNLIGAINGGKTGLIDFEETDKNQFRKLRSSLNVNTINGFLDTGHDGAESSYSGCFAVRNPVTSQITYQTIIHCHRCWPVFLKAFGKAGCFEGRGSAPVLRPGANTGLNKSLLASGPKSFLVCNDNSCDEETATGGKQQNDILPNANADGNDLCRMMSGTYNGRSSFDSVSVGHATNVFAIDQWGNTIPAALRSGRKRESNGEDPEPAGITRIANCGDIDPLILVGFRYACLAKDALGHILSLGGDDTTTLDENGEVISVNSPEYLGRCDKYFIIKPACNDYALPLSSHVGEITNLDGHNGPCIIRRGNPPATTPDIGSTRTYILPRIDANNGWTTSGAYWNGPYQDRGMYNDAGPYEAYNSYSSSMKDVIGYTGVKFNAKEKIDPKTQLKALKGKSYDTVAYERNAGPLEALIPYGAVCDICNPGSPMCGYYGTCRDDDKPNLWEASATLRLQSYFNEPWYGKSIAYSEIKASYRRDCQEKHCCRSVPDDVLKKYCEQREIKGGNKRCNKDGCWTYKGVPNKEAQSWNHEHLPRLGGFPLCSSGAIAVTAGRVGECCTADVATAPGGSGKAPLVELKSPFEQFGSPVTDNTNGPRTGCQQFVTLNGPNIAWNENWKTSVSKQVCGLRRNTGSSRTFSSENKLLCRTDGSPFELINRRWCPLSTKVPRMKGTCLDLDPLATPTSDTSIMLNYPIGGEEICGPAYSHGLMGIPEGGDPTPAMCQGSPATFISGNLDSFTTPTVTTKSKEYLAVKVEEVDVPDPTLADPNNTKKEKKTTSADVDLKKETTCTTTLQCGGTPIFLSLDNSKPVILNKKVCFAFNQTQRGLSYKWIKANKKQGFLAIDLNGDGKINDGRELFGNLTGDIYFPDGYTALSFLLDTNNDMLISGSELDSLLLWQDLNENGLSEKGELKPLKTFGIIELDVGKYYSGKKERVFFDKDVSAIYYSKKGLKLNNKKTAYTWDLEFKGFPNKKCYAEYNKRYITQKTFSDYLNYIKAFLGDII